MHIVGVSRELVARQIARQQFAQRNARLIGAASVAQSAAHIAMDAHAAGAHHAAVQRGDVTVAYNPLLVFMNGVERYLIEELRRAITATGAQDGLDAGVAQGPQQVGSALLGGTGIHVISLKQIFASHGPVAPTLYHLAGLVHRRIFGRAAWRYDGNLVAFFQELRHSLLRQCWHSGQRGKHQ